MTNQTVLCGDSIKILGEIDLSGVSCVISDPPYGIDLDTDFSGMESRLGGFKGKFGGKKYEKVQGDVDFDFFSYWQLVKGIKRHIYFGGDYFIPRDIFRTGSMSIWDKRLTESADKMFGSCFESIWYYPPQKRNIIRYKWAGVFGMEKEKEPHRMHPTQKPLELMRKIISENTSEGDVILDPFAGSGSTLVAAKQLKRGYIGIEISPKYCEIIKSRLSQDMLPL